MRTLCGIKQRGILVTIIIGVLVLAGFDPAVDMLHAQQPLYVYFESDSAELSGQAKKSILDYARQLRVDDREKVLVIGHADTTGDDERNLELSRQRAAAVASAFIRAATIEPERVRAVGYGSRAFETKAGNKIDLARSRRVEIHTMAIPADYPLDLAWIRDHNSVFVYKNLERARRFLFEKKIELALLAIKEAERLGGRHYAQWHLVYGAIGYYEGLNPVRLKEIFKTAVSLDPYNPTARDYYQRARAREKFYRGQIRPDMGLSRNSVIRVDSSYEAFEYLRLFNVSPLQRIRSTDPHFETWICEDEHGKRITYHFRSQTASRWAFSQ